MSVVMEIWGAHLRSLRNVSGRDRRLQIGLVFTLLFSLGVSLWGGGQLLTHIREWQEHGALALQDGLWSICLGTWSGMGLFTILGVQGALSSDETVLLFTLPLAPTVRFRALLGSFFITNLWLLQVIQVGFTAAVLLSTLGWDGLLWLIVLQLGVIVAVIGYLLVTLLVLRYVLPAGQFKACLGMALLALAAIALIAALYRSPLVHALPVQLWLRPEAVGIVFVCLLAVGLGPGANGLGKLYEAAFYTIQSQDWDRKALTLPGMQALRSLFERRRDLTGALFGRALAGQSRNLFFWTRLAMGWALLALFPFLRTALGRYGFTDTALVAGYAATLALGHIIETGPSALSGEGNRLTLYLTAALTPGQLLRAKLSVFLWPALLEGLAMGWLLAWDARLPYSQLLFVLSIIALIVAGGTTLLVCGSAWDADIDKAVEGLVETLMQEEVPLTPRRMLLFNAALLLLGANILLLWKLPSEMVLVAVTVLNLIVVVSMWRLGKIFLQQLVV